MEVARLIADCRRRAGLSQRQLAARAGTSAAAVCLYESGRRVPRVDTLTRLIAATGSTLHLAVRPAGPVDVEANARVLEQLLDLADQLPHRRPGNEIDTPPFRALAR